ncbi:fatty acyl-CoA reductase wat-like [Hyposmocoma kahamanoa]|uniref:fatty acyl-CoA reductase wat-like n=1 Tax=Hyposmocoma kahamanoa TaxID=1477025 RepID=UPI000E6D8E58|nr:fatty acyl-CoA reductase wat-like [Hyposmocoma kahamanoa]
MDPAQAILLEEITKNSIVNETILRGDSTVQQFYENAVIFVSGGSGFLGKNLIEKLLRSCNVKKIYVLLRPKKQKTVEERLAQLVDDSVFECLRTMKPNYASKICVIPGDVGELSLGISSEDTRIVTEEVNVIFHAAATTNFMEHLKKAILINTRGTQEMLKLAKNCKKLKSFIYVSTAYSHATKKYKGKTMLEEFQPTPYKPELMIQLAEQFNEAALESMTPSLLREWPNTYSFTKAISEELVRNMVGQFPIAVSRPAIVIGAYREPSPGWIDLSAIYGASGMIMGIGVGILHLMYSRQEILLDWVPVDLVSNAIVASGQRTAVRWSNGHKDIKIYTTTGYRNPQSLHQHTKIIRKQASKVTTDKAIWYNFLIHVESFPLFVLLFWLMHYIPAYLVDGMLILMRRRPVLRKLYAKAYRLNAAVSVYLHNEWKFDDSNLYEMYKELSPADQIIYNSDMADLDWKRYIVIWCIGIRKYIVKDGINKTEYAVKKQKRYLNTLTGAHKLSWKCITCVSKVPKKDNTNTPVRGPACHMTVTRGAAAPSPPSPREEISVRDESLDESRDVPFELTGFGVEKSFRVLVEEVRLSGKK